MKRRVRVLRGREPLTTPRQILSPYERRVTEDIQAWLDAKPGLGERVLDLLGLPVALVIRAVPGALMDTVTRAIEGFLAMLKDASYWTYRDEAIMKAARKAGLPVRTVGDLARQDLTHLDRLSRGFVASGKLFGALEGAGCGLGGLALIAADVPLLFAIAFRTIQQIGTCYGFDMADPRLYPVVMKIFHAGTATSATVKAAALADLHAASLAFTAGSALGRTSGAAAMELLKRGMEHLPRHLAEHVTRRKIGQAVPVAGAAVSAGFNYWFMGTVALAAVMMFRQLYLERKYTEENIV